MRGAISDGRPYRDNNRVTSCLPTNRMLRRVSYEMSVPRDHSTLEALRAGSALATSALSASAAHAASSVDTLPDPNLLESETDDFQHYPRSIQQPIWRVWSIVQVFRPVLPSSTGVDRAMKVSRDEETIENL